MENEPKQDSVTLSEADAVMGVAYAMVTRLGQAAEAVAAKKAEMDAQAAVNPIHGAAACSLTGAMNALRGAVAQTLGLIQRAVELGMVPADISEGAKAFGDALMEDEEERIVGTQKIAVVQGGRVSQKVIKA
jgi:hypothetical protein